MKKYFCRILVSFFLIIPNLALSANHYVRAGTTGNNAGTDWTNAYTSLPANLVRGDTYYIADGNYSGYTFDDPASGSSVITIVKATQNNHGSDAGWSNSYGDGQASWGLLNFNSSYWVFDGQTGFGTGSQESYGFRISYSGTGQGVKLVKFNNSPSYIMISHVDMEHAGTFGDYAHDIIYSLGGHHYTFSYCYMHDVGRAPILFRGTSNCIFEYCYIARNESTANEHSEAISAAEGSDRTIFRYCFFEDIEGTTCILLTGDGWEIYGNVIFWTPGFNRSSYGNGAIGTWGAAENTSTNAKIYNNVFANLTSALNGGLGIKSGNNVAYNNLWYNCTKPRLNGVSHDYNSFFSCADNSAVSGEPHAQVATGNPFVDVVRRNFRLLAGTAPGLKLNSPYDKDADGKIRGADGTSDRGAFEFSGSAGGNLAPIPNAGPDQFIQVGTEVTLDGSNSSDPNGDNLTYRWEKISGPSVSLSSTTQVVVSFTSTVVGTYVFRLTVNDGQVSTTDEVQVVVLDKSQVNADSGLVAYWKVDESTGMLVRDFAGSHNGTLVNGPVWRPKGGKISGGLEFDGVDDYVDIGNLDIIGGSGLTLALWFRADDFDASYARLISKATGSTADDDHYWMVSTSESDGTGLRFRLKAGGSTTLLKTSTGQIRAGIWYHVAATYDGSRMRIYKNGVEVASTNKSGVVDTNPNVLAAISSQPAGAGDNWPFDGLIDEVRIYNRALRATEIAAIVNPVTTGLSGSSPQEIPATCELNQNYPNPFSASGTFGNPSTTISYSLPKDSQVDLTIYDLSGREVYQLVDKFQPAGRYEVRWYGSNAQGIAVPSGVYYSRLRVSNQSMFRRMILLK